MVLANKSALTYEINLKNVVSEVSDANQELLKRLTKLPALKRRVIRTSASKMISLLFRVFVLINAEVQVQEFCYGPNSE